ncbi:MAG: hypothetical protein AAFQ68_00045 [Bacteroidota bacterium]
MRVFCFVLVCLLACQSSTPQQAESRTLSREARPNVGRVEWIPNPEATPDPSPRYADVFQPWDGHWRGVFRIFRDTSGTIQESQPRIEEPRYILEGPFQETMKIEVEQFYTSTSPFYQEVRIIDTYTDGDGELKQVESTGFNRVLGDTLFCVVNKPGEQVVHTGTARDPQIIVWERDLRNPLKIEYFFEQVQDSTYSILGWGYYGEDDPNAAPKSWFYGEYKRQ